jgi:hypothetical protein
MASDISTVVTGKFRVELNTVELAYNIIELAYNIIEGTKQSVSL